MRRLDRAAVRHLLLPLLSGRRHDCLSSGIHYEGFEDMEWMSLCLPTPPFEWRAEIEDWLRQVGGVAFAAVGFRLGLVGLEAELAVSAEQVPIEVVPKERWFGYLWPEDGRLAWYLATHGPTISLDPE